MKIAILHDRVAPAARLDEFDALVQADAVGSALERIGHRTVMLGVSSNLSAVENELKRAKPDLVFNLVESLDGRGRMIHVIPGLLDAMGIPYTGCSSEAQFATSNKLFAKRTLRAGYLPTSPWHTMNDLRQDHDLSLGPNQLERERGFVPGPYIIKSVWEHSSVGLDDDSVVTADDPSHLLDAMEYRLHRLGGEAFAEAYIDGREFNLALLEGPDGPEVLPPAEIVFDGYPCGSCKPRIVSYRAKWAADSFDYRHTPRRYEFGPEDSRLLSHISSLAVDCWRLFDLRGYARVDFRVDDVGRGRPWILEINANPCLSSDAGFAAALQQAEIPFPHAIERILEAAIRPGSVMRTT